MMKKILVEYDTGHVYGPASEQALEKYLKAKSLGVPYFLYPYCGYHLRMTVALQPRTDGPEEVKLEPADVHHVQKDKAPG